MKRIFFLLSGLLLGAFVLPVFGQDEPITDIFPTSVIIDNQSTTGPAKGGIHFTIHHRFSKMVDIKDLYGVYGASNVRMGLDYGVTDKIMLGFGTEKYSKMQEFRGKVALLQQTPGKWPVSVSVFGNAVIDGRDKAVFEDDFKFADRMSYFGQLLIARRLTEKISVQVAPSYGHFNKVDSTFENDFMGIMLGARANVYNDISLYAEYSASGWYSSRYYQTAPKPNLAFGVEFGTPTHAFQIFVTSYDQIVAQKCYNYNQNDFTKDGYRVGFNITVRF